MVAVAAGCGVMEVAGAAAAVGCALVVGKGLAAAAAAAAAAAMLVAAAAADACRATGVVAAASLWLPTAASLPVGMLSWGVSDSGVTPACCCCWWCESGRLLLFKVVTAHRMAPGGMAVGPACPCQGGPVPGQGGDAYGQNLADIAPVLKYEQFPVYCAAGGMRVLRVHVRRVREAMAMYETVHRKSQASTPTVR